MKVLVDFTQIPADRAGVGVYAENLVRELLRQLPTGDTLFLLIQKDEKRVRELIRDCPNAIALSLPTSLLRNRALLFLFEQVVIPLLLLCKKIDVVHSLHYTHPLVSPCPRVVTIHDLTHFLHPELHTLGRRLVLPFFIKRAMRHSEGLIFDSHATRADAERLIPTKRVNLRTVVPLGVDLQGFEVSDQAAKDVLERFSIRQPFVLFVGTIEPRKNVSRLLRAFEQIASEFPDLFLVLAGKPGWHYNDVFTSIKTSNLRDRIRYLGFVSDSDKSALLATCEVLTYPSLYEGFGLPVLEGMAAGAPVVTSNVSSMPEVVGDAALLVNPLSVQEIADAIRTILNSRAKREELSLLGKRRAAIFSWAKAAARTYEVYMSVAETPVQRSQPRQTSH